VLRDKTDIDLTSKEYNFLLYLAGNKNRVFTREQLINSIWGYDFIGDIRAIVAVLRKQLLNDNDAVDAGIQRIIKDVILTWHSQNQKGLKTHTANV